MRDIRRVLLALDFNPGGRTLTAGSCIAADQAFALASHLGAAVVLFHSAATDEAWDAGEENYVVVQGDALEVRRPVLDEVADRFRRADLDVSVASTDEPAWLGIVRRVLRDRIDLVVAGKRNHPDRRGHPLGSISTKLLRKCPCAVWVARPDGATAPRRVLAASDLTAVGERVVEYGAFVAGHFGAELHVVHAFQLPLAVQIERGRAVADFDRRESEERTRRLEALVARVAGAPKPSIHVGRTSPTRAILECNGCFDPDLVVMGTIARGGVAGLLVGNTAERLLGRLDCSLLTIKPADFVCPVSLED